MVTESITTIEQLLAAREARGLSSEEMLRQLKLAPRQLQAIEQGDWSALPGLAFTRAILRSYGRVLGVDVEPLVASVSGSLHAADLRPSASLDEPMPARSMLGFGSGGGGSRLAWIMLIVLGVIALALFFGGDGSLQNVKSWLADGSAQREEGATASGSVSSGGSATTTQSVPLTGLAGTTAPGSGEQAAAAAGAAAAGSQAPGTATMAGSGATPPGAGEPGAASSSATAAGAAGSPSAALATAPSALATPPSAPATGPSAPAPATATGSAGASATPAGSGAASTPAAEAGQRLVRLTFEEDSWVEAKNADGTVIFSGTQKGRSSRQFSASGPVSLVIGNAEAVRAEVDGKPFDLAPHTRASIARVKLP